MLKQKVFLLCLGIFFWDCNYGEGNNFQPRNPVKDSAVTTDNGTETGTKSRIDLDSQVEMDSHIGFDASAVTDSSPDSHSSFDAISCTDVNEDEPCPNGCLIGSDCHDRGASNPENICEKCDPDTSSSSWSSNDGVDCNDGAFCTINDICISDECTGTPRDCSDGVECTGIETCDEERDTCLAGTSTCDDNYICNTLEDRCDLVCTGCVIDDVCYENGQTNPLGGCGVCDINHSEVEWSDKEDGVQCDDGIFCNGSDSCVTGECVAHDNSSCPDDGLYCTGTEGCDEVSDSCYHTGNPCSDDERCIEETDECCTPNIAVTEPVCDGTGDVIAYDSCGDEVLIEDCSDTHGLCNEGECDCQQGWYGDDCNCVIYVDGDKQSVDAEVSDEDGGTSGDGGLNDDGRTWETAFSSLQAGIDAVDDGGCAVWVRGGITYSENIVLKDKVYIYGGFSGNEENLDERDLANNETILNGGGSGTVVTFVGQVDEENHALLDGFTITNGSNSGMRIEDASPTITNCKFVNNSASKGGGVYLSNGNPTFANCIFEGNSTAPGMDGGNDGTDGGNSGSGGGMYIDSGAPQLSGCIFNGNYTGTGGTGCNGKGVRNVGSFEYPVLLLGGRGCDGGNSGCGGGIYINSGEVFLSRCSFISNRTGEGGAGGDGVDVFCDDDCEVRAGGGGCAGTSGSGGGIYIEYPATLNILNSEFRNNYTGDGGVGGNGGWGSCSGIFEGACCEYSGDYGRGGISGSGGAICVGEYWDPGGSLVAIGCSFTNNHTGKKGLTGYQLAPAVCGTNYENDFCEEINGSGGAIAKYNDYTGQQTSLANCILWGNRTYGDGPQLYGVTDVVYSDVQGWCSPGPECSDTNWSVDPQFVYGTSHLSSSSPCIDTGDNSAVPADLAEDLDGNPRIVDGDGDGIKIVDMGAYEYQLPEESE